MRPFLFLVIAVSLFPYSVPAQDYADTESFLETLLSEYPGKYINDETEQKSRYDTEEILDHFASLAANPVNINRATRYDLEKLFVLTPFQIEVLLDYRSRGGALLSLSELSLLNGFNERLAEFLRPFIIFGPSGGGFDRENAKFRSDFYLRSFTKLKEYAFEKKDELGPPVALLLKYRCSYGDKFRLNITAENDMGEELFASMKRPVDFFSIALSCDNVALGGKRRSGFLNNYTLNTFVLGDFSARFGQGLVLWNSFSFGSPSNPSALCRRGAAVLPYTSAGESRFYRGAALSVSGRKIDFALLFSHKKRDAKLENGKYVTLYDDGLHNIGASLDRRKNMAESLFGVNAVYNSAHFRIGLNYAAYMYDRKSGVKPNYYNSYRLYDALWGNFSLSFSGNLAKFNLFGEVAADHGGTIAFLAGFTRRFADVQTALLIRYYPASYIAPHAGAFSSLSGCYNQFGAVALMNWQLPGALSIEGMLDGCYYPKPRFNIRGKSAHLKGSVKLTYKSERETSSYSVELSNTWLSASNLYSFPTNKVALAVNADFLIGDRFSLGVRSRHSVILKKYSIATGIKAGCNLRKFDMKGGITLYDARLWANRLYDYESDLPSTYGAALLYGRGVSGYMLLKYGVSENTALYAKFSSARGSQYIKLGLKVKLN